MSEIVRTRVGNLTFLAPVGPCSDEEGVAALTAAFESCLSSRELGIALDLDRVPALSGAAIEALLDAQERLSGLGGSLKVINANSLVLDIFLITGFADYVEVVKSPYGD